MTRALAVDPYVVDVLMQDLTGHDRSPAAFIVYLYLYAAAERADASLSISHNRLSEATGLSKSAVQAAVKHLVGRKLLKQTRTSPTAVPQYNVLRPWARRK
jgi:hypothetical protein